MTREEIEDFIRARSRYPVVRHSEHPDGHIVIIGTRGPDGQLAGSSLIISGLRGTEEQQKATLASRIDAAQDGLERYLQSFVRPNDAGPKWDQDIWGP